MSTSPDGDIDVAVLDSRPLVREALESMLSREAGLRVVASTRATSVAVVGKGVQAPAGCIVVRLRSTEDMGRLVARIRRASGDGGHGGLDTAAERTPTELLSARERAVLSRVGSGASAGQIAVDLGISPRSVERHKQSVMAKLGVRSQAGAVALSVAHGLLHDGG